MTFCTEVGCDLSRETTEGALHCKMKLRQDISTQYAASARQNSLQGKSLIQPPLERHSLKMESIASLSNVPLYK